MPKINCVVCGNEKYYTPYNIRKNGGKYCSRECYKNHNRGINHRDWKGGRKEKVCITCSSIFLVIRSSQQKTCSSKCMGMMIKKRFEQNRVFKKCEICDNRFIITPSRSKRKFCSKKCFAISKKEFLGEKNPNWKGGSKISMRIRSSEMGIQWRESVFKRDNYICQKCGYDKGGKIHAHHINHLSKIINENNVASMIDAIKCEQLWDVSNGITLCVTCHRKEHKNDRPKK